MEAVQRQREDWTDEAFVDQWLGRQHGRSAERLRQFAILRSLVPKRPDESFRYINVGGGDGWLDEVLLKHFVHAQGTVVDGSPLMIRRAQERLAGFGERATCLVADFSSPGWTSALKADFDVALSSIAIHNLGDPTRIRAVYAEIFDQLRTPGFFANLDYVRPVRPALRAMSRWAGQDLEAGYVSRSTGGGSSGTMEEQMVWFREAGFAPVDCFWKEFQVVVVGGFKGAVNVPDAP